MKTAAIFFEVPENVKYLVFDGDKRHLHGPYIKGSNSEETKIKELSELIYNEKGYVRENVIFHSLEEFRQAVAAGSYLIECGFYL